MVKDFLRIFPRLPSPRDALLTHKTEHLLHSVYIVVHVFCRKEGKKFEIVEVSEVSEVVKVAELVEVDVIVEVFEVVDCELINQ